MSEIPKQIIVIRSDLRNTKGEKIRTGKLISQCCHASLGTILNYGGYTNENEYIIRIHNDAILDWLNGIYTKVVVQVSDEKSLLDIHQKCIDNNINVKLITDLGLTEFGGIPTNTCLGIGPDYPSKLDPLFRHLPLL